MKLLLLTGKNLKHKIFNFPHGIGTALLIKNLKIQIKIILLQVKSLKYTTRVPS